MMRSEESFPTRSPLAPPWLQARDRITALRTELDGRYAELAFLVDHAGAELEKLRRLFERERSATAARDAWTEWLDFIDADLVDVMRSVSIDAACLVPGDDWRENADPVETAADAELLTRYLTLATLAAEHAAIPERARRVTQEVSGAMAGWCERMVGVVRAIEAAQFGAPDGRDRESSTREVGA